MQRGRAIGRKRKETMIGWIRERRMNKDELKGKKKKEDRRKKKIHTWSSTLIL